MKFRGRKKQREIKGRRKQGELNGGKAVGLCKYQKANKNTALFSQRKLFHMQKMENRMKILRMHRIICAIGICSELYNYKVIVGNNYV